MSSSLGSPDISQTSSKRASLKLDIQPLSAAPSDQSTAASTEVSSAVSTEVSSVSMSAPEPTIQELLAKPRSELTEYEVGRVGFYELTHGPFRLLYNACNTGNQVLINTRGNRKLLARVKAFDRHCNMVLENVKEMWTERPRGAPKGKLVNRDRFISKMFLRGDVVILVMET